MDVGLMTCIRRHPERPEPFDKVYNDFIDDAVYAEELGFDLVQTSEHHFAPDGWTPSQLPVLAAIAARTSRVRLQTNVLIMPYHHPIRLAEDVATVDIISRGRLDLIAGTGSIQDEFDTFGIDSNTRWGRLFEGLEILKRGFEEKSFDYHGKYWNFDNIRIMPKPIQRPFPLWVGGFGPQLMERAGRGGYHVQGGGPHLAKYEAALRESGHNPDDFNHEVFAMGFVAENDDKAWEAAGEGLRYWQSFYRNRQWIAHTTGGHQIPPLPDLKDYRYAEGFGANAPVGSPDTVLRKLEAQLHNSGTTDFGFAFRHAGMQTDVVRASMKLFAKEVLPVVKTWGREPKRSPKVVR